jgi:hypothetical protein
VLTPLIAIAVLPAALLAQWSAYKMASAPRRDIHRITRYLPLFCREMLGQMWQKLKKYDGMDRVRID